MERRLGKVRVDFKCSWAGLGRIPSGTGGEPTGLRHGPAAHNVPVDEFIAGAEFRQVPEQRYQVDVFVAGVALPSTSVAHWLAFA